MLRKKVRKVLTAILIILVLISAFMALKNKIAVRAITYYLLKNGYKEPNDDEIKECTYFVIKKMFGLS